MTWSERRQRLSEVLQACRSYWQPQPFRTASPEWLALAPELAARLTALPIESVRALDADAVALNVWLAEAEPRLAAALAELAELTALPPAVPRALPLSMTGSCWDWAIPGRKRAQIEAFAAAVAPSGRPLFDWCGGKGHLARLLALSWQVPATTLEIDHELCAAGRTLGERAGVEHRFVAADALAADVLAEAHVVALHACGELHRRLVERVVPAGVAALDLAPCCYYRGIAEQYQPLTASALQLSRDDVRVAVTETVTASPRLVKKSEREMAWKLAFTLWRERVAGGAYRTFKPVPGAWMNGDFAAFMARLCRREGLAAPAAGDLAALEAAGRQRQEQVARHSLLRHAFRRALEVWLALDLAVHLENSAYAVTLATFCPPALTPRNLLLSARRVAS